MIFWKKQKKSVQYPNKQTVKAYKRNYAQVDSNASVAFMTWYIELLGKDEKSVKILVDTEDLTVYYIKVNDSAFWEIISAGSIF